MAAILEKAWLRYLSQLDRRPLQTKALTSGTLAGLSDVLAQKLASKAPLNWRRTLAMALFGLLVSGPVQHFWQARMERLFRGRKDLATILQRVALDNLTIGPLHNVAVMSYISLLVEGRSWAFTKSKLRSHFPAVQLAAWRVWPLASFVNYRYVPLKLRVLFINLCALAWSTFIISKARTASSLPLPLLAAATR